MYLVYQLLGRHTCSVVPCSAHRRSYTIEQAHLSFQLCRYCHVLVTHNQHCNIGGASRASKVTVLHQWMGILETQWKEYCEEGKVVVLGKVRHSYAASKSLLKPWVIIRTNGTVEAAHCTSMAGSAVTCSYIGAIHHWVVTAAFIHNDTPCTSLEDKWLMPAPVQDIMPSLTCIPTSSRKIEAPSPSEIEFFSHMIGEENRTSILS